MSVWRSLSLIRQSRRLFSDRAGNSKDGHGGGNRGSESSGGSSGSRFIWDRFSQAYPTTQSPHFPSSLPASATSTYSQPSQSSILPTHVSLARIYGMQDPSRSAGFMKYTFDTYRFVQRLEAEGYTRDQAEAIMNSLAEVVSERVDGISASAVSKIDFEKIMYMHSIDFHHLKKDLHTLNSNDLSVLKTELIRLTNDLARLRLRAGEELRRIHSNVRLELSLEKGRLRDEQSEQEINIRESDARIESETGNIRVLLEGVSWELVKTLFPLFAAAGALALGFLRFIR